MHSYERTDKTGNNAGGLLQFAPVGDIISVFEQQCGGSYGISEMMI